MAHQTRTTILAAALAAMFGASPATALPDGPVVVELFTSQGCNSCPPADLILGELAGQEGVIALSLHVDYWDYLGWRDTFARTEFTRRQFDYRDAWRERVVFTPQMVVQGAESVSATDRAAIAAAVARAAQAAPGATLDLVEEGGVLRLAVGRDVAPDAELWIASFDRESDVAIVRGENAGRTITYHNVVKGLERLGPVAAVPEGHVLPLPGPGEGVAVWVQDGSGGPILAAASRVNGETVSLRVE